MKPDLDWFVDARFGMFIHWGLYSLASRHEWVQNYEKVTAEEYARKYFDKFDPDLYDPKAWARAARKAGMKYVVVTTKHHEGFCLWDSKFTDFKATNSPAGRDLIRPLVEAFREEGIRIGLYYSLIDWHHPQFPVDMHHPLRYDQDKINEAEKRDVTIYAEYMRNQVSELLTDYGKIDIVWFDYSYIGEGGKAGKGCEDWQSEKLIKLVRELQPGIIVNNRLDLPDKPDFLTPEQYLPYARPLYDGQPITWEGCHTFSGSWGYHRDEATWKSDKQCICMLVDSVSKGGNLLMNVGPTARGEFDERATAKLDAIGEWLRLNGRSIYGCMEAPAAFEAPQDTRLTYNPKTNRLYIHVFNWPYGGIYLPECYKDKIEYAQLLSDSSELLVQPVEPPEYIPNRGYPGYPPLIIQLPTVQPEVEVPVIELFLRN